MMSFTIPLRSFLSRFGRPGPAFADHLALSRQRRRLAQLDAAQLRDIGLTREQAADEARRYFWDAPAHWADSSRR